MNPQARAILWAQWRSVRNLIPRSSKGGIAVTLFIGALWFGMWGIGAVAVGLLVQESRDPQALFKLLGPGLMLMSLYWQLFPLLMVNTGASLEMRKLRVYPIPRGDLFGLEVILRVSMALELLVVLAGGAVGYLLNPSLNPWYVLALVPYVAFNLFLAAGTRELLTRLLGGRRFREVAFMLLFLVSALPQLLVMFGLPDPVKKFLTQLVLFPWPWTATAWLLCGDVWWLHFVSLALWVAVAYAFGRWQFERSLSFDEEAARAGGAEGVAATGWVERLFRLPRLIPDPIGAMVEKEVRTLGRAPRFRVLFLMGFSFGLLVWLPMAGGKRAGVLEEHYLVVLFVYSLMLLSEVAVWNILGFDRSAAQLYWLSPVKPWQVLVAKNLATTLYAILEMVLITAVCLALRMPLDLLTVCQSFLVALLLLVMMISVGNVSSIYYPRAVDPNQNWKRAGGSRFHIVLVLVEPILLLPFLVAYWARWAWESDAVFYAVLAFTALLAALMYGVSMELATKAAGSDKERVLTALGRGEGPVAA